MPQNTDAHPSFVNSRPFGDLRRGDVIRWSGSPGALVTHIYRESADSPVRSVTIAWLSTAEHYGERFVTDLAWAPDVPVNLVTIA